jgi:hypothetical protein
MLIFTGSQNDRIPANNDELVSLLNSNCKEGGHENFTGQQSIRIFEKKFIFAHHYTTVVRAGRSNSL